MKSLRNVKLATDDISQYNILAMNKNIPSNERTEKLLKLLAENSPARMREKLIALCTEFSDIFALDTDKATQNNFSRVKCNRFHTGLHQKLPNAT